MSKRARTSTSAKSPDGSPNNFDATLPYYFSSASNAHSLTSLPDDGMPARYAADVLIDTHVLDNKEQLNTSSYVTVAFEKEEEDVIKLGSRINLADQTVYPSSFSAHNSALNMIAQMWHCPKPENFDETGAYNGAGTVGSTEACLLAALALKFRWRAWYQKKYNLSKKEVLSVTPNIVMSTCFQAAWEKAFRYFDIEPKLVKPSVETFTITAEALKEKIDDKTIAVVCIMGNHYGGQYDPVWDVDAMLTDLNKEKGYQVGIHVDGASGGFIAPFQQGLKPWDFRLANVLSISASGHKFGQAVCGTGWLVFREREDLSEHIAISVTYLGGHADSYTLNFSRSASAVYSQYYKLLRLGRSGYTASCNNMMSVSKFIRDGLKSLKFKGLPRFEMLDYGDTHCLPVVTARLNPALKLSYNDIDLQHALAQDHWYVSGYRMFYLDPLTEEKEALFHNQDEDSTLFRVVVKINLSMYLAENLLTAFKNALDYLDNHAAGFSNATHAASLKRKHGHATC